MPTIYSGIATIDFGIAPVTVIYSINITKQIALANNSVIRAYIQGDITPDFNDYEHQMLSTIMTIIIGNIIPNVGFTITCWSQMPIIESIYIKWFWM